MREIAAAAGAELQQWLLGLVNSPEHRLAGAQQMADSLAEHLRNLSSQAGEAILRNEQRIAIAEGTPAGRQEGQQELVAVPRLLLPPAGRRPAVVGTLRRAAVQIDAQCLRFLLRTPAGGGPRLTDYFELRLHELTLNAFCRLVGLVLAQVATVGDKLRNLAADFNRLIEQFSVPPAVDEESTVRTRALQRVAAARIAARKSELLAEMEQSLEDEFRRAATTEIRDVRSKLAVVVRRTSRTLILRMLKQFAAEEATAALEGRPHEPLIEIPAGMKEALPQQFTACGGQRRLLIVAPEQLAPAVTAQFPGNSESPPPTVLADAGSDLLVCYEVEELPLPRVAAKVLDQRFQAVEAASRLHTRTDVAWTPL